VGLTGFALVLFATGVADFVNERLTGFAPVLFASEVADFVNEGLMDSLCPLW